MYILYFCRKYGTETVANTKEFQTKYVVLSKKQTSGGEVALVNETLKNKVF
jgi:hypothetical protein